MGSPSSGKGVGRRWTGLRRWHGALLVPLLAAACGSSSTSSTTSSSAPNTGSGGSSSSSSSQSGGYKVVYVSPITSNSEWKRSSDLLTQWAQQHGDTATTVGPSDTVDIPTIVNDIQQAITQHPDVIITCACQGGAFDNVLKTATQAGIITVTLAADSAPGTRSLFLGTSYQALGKNAADSFIQKMGGHARIGVVRQNATVQNQVEELAAFKAELASQPDMQVVDDVTDDSDAAKAQSVISQMITTHPEINAIWTLEGTSPGVVEPTLKSLNKQPGQINVLGIDLTAATRQAINDGYLWATEYQQFFDATPLAAQCGIELKQGKQLSSTNVDTGTLLVTKDNMPPSLPPANEKLPSDC